MSTLPISVIICAKNAEHLIVDCLDSVQANNPAEIIVIDDMSTDRTMEIAREYTNHVYSNEGKGFTYSQQMGAEKATQEFINYVDADVVVPPDTLVTMLDEFRQSDCVSICAQTKPVANASYWERAVQQHIEIIMSRQGGGSLMCGLLRRNTIMSHPFDPFVNPGPDSDLYKRLKKQGYKFSISSAFIYHRHRADFKSFTKQRWWYGRGKARYAWRRGLFDYRSLPPIAVVYMLGFSLIKGKPNLIPYFFLDGIIETAGMVKGFSEILRESLSHGGLPSKTDPG